VVIRYNDLPFEVMLTVPDVAFNRKMFLLLVMVTPDPMVNDP
jgi:hypothetical protein